MFEPGEKGGWMAKLLHNKTGRIQQPAKCLEHGDVIVEEPDTIAGGSTQRRAFRVQIFETIKGICIGHVMIQSGLLRITMGLRSMPRYGTLVSSHTSHTGARILPRFLYVSRGASGCLKL